MKMNINAISSIIFLIWLAYICSGCITAKKLPSVCDDQTSPSYLCAIAEKHNTKLETIGNIIIAANTVAIGEGYYQAKDALKVAKDLRGILNNPISYLYFKARADAVFIKHPGMLTIARIYIDDFVSPQIMTAKDRKILQRWFEARIAGLEALIDKPAYGNQIKPKPFITAEGYITSSCIINHEHGDICGYEY